MKKSTLLSVLTFLFLATNLKAQNTAKELYDPYTPEYFTGTDPAWLQDIQKNPRGVNFFEMEKKFQEWLSTDPDAKKKTVDKKPAVNFYRRWQRAYKPFVNAKGEIVLPTKEAYFKKLDAQNQQANRQLSAKRRKRSATTNQWKSIGPFKTAKNNPNDGYKASHDSHANVFRIDVYKKNSNILYCGTQTGVVFKTTNKGEIWTACNPVFNFGGKIMAIQIDPDNSNIVWVGSDSGLFLTKNGGESFERILPYGIQKTVNSIKINENNTNLITIATNDGFYVYNHFTKSYRKTFNGMCYDHELKPKSNYIVYLLAQSKYDYDCYLYISYNNGVSFNKKDRVQILQNVRMGRLAVSQADGGEEYLYALVNTHNSSFYNGEPHIVQSKDGGKNWENKTVKVKNDRYADENTFCPYIDGKQGGQGYYDMMVGASDTNPEHIIFGLCSAYRSFNGGSGGQRQNTIGGYCRENMQMHPDMQDIAIAGEEVWIANDGGIKYSSNFFQTEGENRLNGIYTADFYGFGQGWNEDVMAGGRWHNGDAVMINNKNYDYAKTSVDVGGVEKATGYVMLSNPRKVYFSDAARMFTMPEKINGQIIEDEQPFYIIRPYELLQSFGFFGTDPRYAQRILFYPQDRNNAGAGKIAETKDEGYHINDIWNTENENISNIEFARSNPNTIYACGITNLFKSTDNGKTWDTFLIPNPSSSSSYIAVDPKNENKLWLVKSQMKGGVIYSENGGKNWIDPLNDELRNKIIRWVVLVGDEYNGVYLGTDEESKVYYKDDNLGTWIDYSNGLPPAARLTRLVPFFKEGKLRAATSQGIWEIPLYRQKFKPIAQPIALNLGDGTLNDANTPIQFDSYSIVNQNGVQWEWSISPEPYSITDKNKRNPIVIFRYNGEYDVTLKVTTPHGSHSRTISKMIKVTNGENDRSSSSSPKPTCVKLANNGPILPSKIITSSLNKQVNNLNDYRNGFIKMESTDKPFIITRLTTAQRDNIKDPKEGMLIWNTTTQKLDLYKGDKWQEIAKSCNE